MTKAIMSKCSACSFRVGRYKKGVSSGAEFHLRHIDWVGRSREKAWKQAVILSISNNSVTYRRIVMIA